jgi:hypothetical protein
VPGTPLKLIDVVSYLDADFFSFVAPPGGGSADIVIEFWNSANDIDLYLYQDNNPTPIAASITGDDGERILQSPLVPGATYKIGIEEAGFGYTPTFYDLTISLGPEHVLDAAPSGTPNPVVSGGVVSVNANATDTLGHFLTYLWRAACPDLDSAGTFSDRTVAAPTWTAPFNTTAGTKNCTLTVDVDDGAVLPLTVSYVQGVVVVPHGISFTTAPSGSPNPVSSGGAVSLSVVASDTFGHTVFYSWQASCPGLGNNGSFTPGADAQNPVWTAPVNTTGSIQNCTMSVTAQDHIDQSTTTSFVERVNTVADLVTITSGPAGTPDPVASGGAVTTSVTRSTRSATR